MVLGHKYGQMALNTLGNGKIIMRMDREHSFILMGINIKVIEKTIKQMGKEFTSTPTQQDMRDIGYQITTTEKEKKRGQMVLVMRESTNMDKNKEKVS